MSPINAAKLRRRVISLAFAGVLIVLLSLRIYSCPERGLDDAGGQSLIDALFGCALTFAVLCASWRIGGLVLHSLLRLSLSETLAVPTRLGIGIGALSTGTSILGFVGAYRPLWLGALLVACFLLPSPQPHEEQPWISRQLAGWKKVLLLITAIITASVFLQGLAPPVDYDALMYHLSAPKLFLAAGRFTADPQLWQTSYPMLIQSLFGLGLAFGTTNLASHLHLSFALLILATTFHLTLQQAGKTAAWLSVLILLGMPVLWSWASWAENDLALCFYCLLGLTLIVESPLTARQRAIIAGIATGFALGTKYFALGSCASLVAILFLFECKSSWRERLVTVGMFLAVSLMLGGAWYLRNLLTVQNPIFPLFWGGRGWPTSGDDLWFAFMKGVGVPLTPSSLLQIPVWLFTAREPFTVLSVERLHPAFILAPLALCLRAKATRATLFFALGTYLTWAFGSQQFRFLAPLFPVLAALAALVATQIAGWLPRAVAICLGFFIFAPFALISLMAQVEILLRTRPDLVITGQESKAAYLREWLHDFRAVDYIRHNLPEDARVFFLWDGMNFYCDNRCLPDTDHVRWSRLVRDVGDPELIHRELRGQGVTHVLADWGGAAFHSRFDPTMAHRRGVQFLRESFIPQYLTAIQDNALATLYELR